MIGSSFSSDIDKTITRTFTWSDDVRCTITVDTNATNATKATKHISFDDATTVDGYTIGLSYSCVGNMEERLTSIRFIGDNGFQIGWWYGGFRQPINDGYGYAFIVGKKENIKLIRIFKVNN